jgi:putative endonuclease
MSLDSRNLGALGEDQALSWYLDHGYELVARNFQYYREGLQGRQGEIDLLVKKGDVLVLVEVKTRSNEFFGKIAEQVTRQKLRFLYKTYQYFLLKNPQYRRCFARLDVAEVMNNEVKVIQNAWSFEH